MRLTMKERSSVVRVVASRYQKGGKKHKGRILNEFMELTGYNRCYAAYLLRSHGRKIRISKDTVIVGDITKKAKRVGHKTYDEGVFHVLKKIWFIMDCICGKRLAPILKEIIAKLEKHKEIALNRTTRGKLLKISAATIDRLSSEEKKKDSLRGRSHTILFLGLNGLN